MKFCWADHRFTGVPDRLTNGIIRVLRENGHTVTEFCEPDYDYIINGSCFFQKAIEKAQHCRNVKLINYCWDFYPWVVKDSTRNYPAYATFMSKGKVWCPNEGTKMRLKEFFNIDATVVPWSIPVYDTEVSDERFVLDPVRYYPEENGKWVEQACAELHIPCKHTEHGLSMEEFRKLVGKCTFITCGYREASTGGLTLMEGLWNGKPSLISNSPYMGGCEYLKEWGNYFQYDSYEDLKEKLIEMWTNTPKIDKEKAREYINNNFSDEALYQRIMEQLCEPKKH